MDIINIENLFNKALRLLDFGKIEKASSILEDIIVETNKEKNYLFFIRASCVLGELLFSKGEIEMAKQHLANVINTPYKNDVVDYEKSIATKILNQIK